MQGRSRMAARSIAVGVLLALVAPSRGAAPPDVRSVKLDLWVYGLGSGGCDVEIKPGHAGCRFQALSKHMGGAQGRGHLLLEFNDVQVRSVDRDCAFSITIREPGQADRTVHRGLRLSPSQPGQPPQVQTLPCYLNSPSMLARTDRARRRQ
jgi:hypothetical protein